MRAGGYGALLRKHPWLQHEESSSSTGSLYNGVVVEEETDEEDNQAPAGEELPLAESQWRRAHTEADKVRHGPKPSLDHTQT